MKATIEQQDDGSMVVTVEKAYSGAVVMPSSQGEFVISHRDGGIEIMLNGGAHWSSTGGYFPGEEPAP